MNYKVAAFYRFVTLDDLPRLQAETKAFCLAHNIKGTTLLAPEGINGTMAGLPEDMDTFIDYLGRVFGLFANVEKEHLARQGEIKFSTAIDMPFRRVKIRLKKEIITLRRPEADPNKLVGHYVEPKDWNALISDPEVLVLDTRNMYETEIGIFKNAVDPHLQVFSEFPEYVEKYLDPKKHKKVAMFCTGGIRCEKASSYMLAHGFENVYHLKGGILKYLEEVPEHESLWDGACYVFDDRVALTHGLKEDM